MIITNDVRKRFCRDTGLNFPSYEAKNFDYYLELYNDMFNSKEKWNQLLQALSYFKSSEEFLKYYIDTKEALLFDIKKTEAYKILEEDDLNCYKHNLNFSKKDIYNMNNIDKYYISIDLKKANFQSLNYYNEDILNAKTYDELISRYNPHDYIKNSKYIREVLFGDLLPKKQQTMERHIIYLLLNEILFQKIYCNNDVCYVNSDEIIFDLSDLDNIEEKIKQIQSICNTLKFDVRIEFYQLKQIGTKNKWFYKDFKNGNKELICVPKLLIPQVIHWFNNEDISEKDLVFKYKIEDVYMDAHFDKPFEI